MKRKIRLTESQLNSFIKKTIKTILKESNNNSLDDYTPSVYVGTYNKYNNGSLKGEWVDLTQFNNKDEFINYCNELHNDEQEGQREFMFQDFNNVPEIFGKESYITEELWTDYINNDEYDMPIKYAVAEYASSIKDYNDYLENMYIYPGCDTVLDVVYQYIDECGGIEQAISHPEDYIDYEQLGREYTWDWDDSEGNVYEYLGVNEDDDEALGEVLADNLELKDIEPYFDYNKFARDVEIKHTFIKYDDGMIEIY